MQYPTISEYVKANQDASDNLDMSTEATNAELLKEAITDEFGVEYSKDGRKLLKAPQKLDGTYSIKEGVRIICNNAFSGCFSLKSLVIPDSVTRIGEGAFLWCSSLSEIVIPSSVTSIGHSAFGDCYSLTSIAIPSSVTSIGEGAFNGCSSLTDIAIPDSVTSIGDNTFMGCTSLSSLVIPSGVTSIGDSTFMGCTSLSSLVIPESVVSIKGNLFCGWYGELKCLSPNFIFEEVCCLTKTKVQLSRLETKTLHHMSFRIMLRALGHGHLGIALL